MGSLGALLGRSERSGKPIPGVPASVRGPPGTAEFLASGGERGGPAPFLHGREPCLLQHPGEAAERSKSSHDHFLLQFSAQA